MTSSKEKTLVNTYSLLSALNGTQVSVLPVSFHLLLDNTQFILNHLWQINVTNTDTKISDLRSPEIYSEKPYKICLQCS